jgi:hypothetical protein
MAAAEPPDPPAAPLEWTIFPNGGDEILAAGRLESAAASQKRAEQKLIETNQSNQQT